MDAKLAPGHTLIGTFNFFPSRADSLTLNTFNGPDVAADQHDHLMTGGLAAHSILSDHLLLSGFGYLPPIEQPRHGVYLDGREATIEEWRARGETNETAEKGAPA